MVSSTSSHSSLILFSYPVVVQPCLMSRGICLLTLLNMAIIIIIIIINNDHDNYYYHYNTLHIYYYYYLSYYLHTKIDLITFSLLIIPISIRVSQGFGLVIRLNHQSSKSSLMMITISFYVPEHCECSRVCPDDLHQPGDHEDNEVHQDHREVHDGAGERL